MALSSTRNLTLAAENDTWRVDAACAGTSPVLFFPVGTTGAAIDQIESAKVVCRTCPVQGPCLEYALLTNQDSGVWGGLAEEERRILRKQRRAAQRRSG